MATGLCHVVDTIILIKEIVHNIKIIHGRYKIMRMFTMMFMMMMTMMRWDGMIRLMLHLIWPDSRRFRTSLTGSLWTFLCSTILQNVFEFICVFICSQQMMFVFCMKLQDVLRYTTPERSWSPLSLLHLVPQKDDMMSRITTSK